MNVYAKNLDGSSEIPNS